MRSVNLARNVNGVRGRVFKTAWGWCGFAASERELCRVVIPADGGSKDEAAKLLDAPLTLGPHKAERMLKDFFAGKGRALKVEVDCGAMTEFERAVLGVVAKIPYGETRSYAAVARLAGRPGAARAVGRVMANNPVPLVVPCHRVVGADGKLGGFSARGGVSTKTRLLAFEKKNAPISPRPLRPLCPFEENQKNIGHGAPF